MKKTTDEMSTTRLFELAQKYAIDRTILELESILKEKRLNIAIKERLEELYKTRELLK